MKNLMKILTRNLSMVAFILAIGAAFAFNSPEERASTWFGVNAQGVIDSNPIDKPDCDDNHMVYCAVEFNNGDLDGGEPPFENVEDTGADQVYLDLIFRP